MALKLMYITNRPEVARIAQAAGVDRIFVDLEYIGKGQRQGGMDTVQSHHTVEDVKIISEIIDTSELLVRVNPIHEKTEEYTSSEEEINAVIENGADIVMLPYYKTVAEVERFLAIVGGRAKTMLLLETPEAVEILPETLELPGIDSIHIGLNDLSLAYGMKFMFQLLTDGTVERLCKQIGEKNIPYGFGGIASLGKGMIPAEMVVKEHYRLGSCCAILSRSFCNVEKIGAIEDIEKIFDDGMKNLRAFERMCRKKIFDLEKNKEEVKRVVDLIISQ